jgi:hypothetical protein
MSSIRGKQKYSLGGKRSGTPNLNRRSCPTRVVDVFLRQLKRSNRMHTGRIGKRKETKTLKVVDVPTVEE